MAVVVVKCEDQSAQAVRLGGALDPQLRPDQQGMWAKFYFRIPAMHFYGESIP